MYKRLLNKSNQRQFDDSDSVSSQEEPRSVDDLASDEENLDNEVDNLDKSGEDQDDNRDFDITDPNLDVVTEEELAQSSKNFKGDFVCTLCPNKKLDSMLAVREHLQSKAHLRREQVAAKLVEEEEARVKAEQASKKKKKSEKPNAENASPSANTAKSGKKKARKSGEQLPVSAAESEQKEDLPTSAKKKKKDTASVQSNKQLSAQDGSEKKSRANNDTRSNANNDTRSSVSNPNNNKPAKRDTAHHADKLKRKRADTESEEQPQHKKQKRLEQQSKQVALNGGSAASKKGNAKNKK